MSGQILKGRIVEITKDYVVIDVGLQIGRARAHLRIHQNRKS